LKVNPQAVVIELGGHDFLKGYERAVTKQNLEAMITQCRAIGAEVVLVEIPRGFITDGYRGLERQIAHEFDLELVPDSIIRLFVLWGPYAPPGMWVERKWRLSDDGLHPNRQGNQRLAEQVAHALTRLYGPALQAEKSPAGQ
jgi:lysophospholipase L1-like esterase